MKRTLALLSALAIGSLGALAIGSPASATGEKKIAGPVCLTGENMSKSVSSDITNRVDSGKDGNWALDNFHRDATVCVIDKHDTLKSAVQVKSWTYLIKGHDKGTFVTQNSKSPQNAAPMLNGMKGTFSGYWSWKFEAPANWLGFTNPTNTNTLSTSEWIAKLWQDGFTKICDFTDWLWKYELCNGEYWINADKSKGGNKGDITGMLKSREGHYLMGCTDKPTFKDKCDESTEITLVNTGPNPESIVLYIVNDLPNTHVIVKAKDSPKVVTVKPESHVTEVSYQNGGKKVTVDHTWTKPAECTVGTTPTPTVPTTAPSTPSLPVTGPNAAIYGGAAAGLLAVGAALFFVARRRRVKFEA